MSDMLEDLKISLEETEDQFLIQAIEMSEKEFKALPEFQGW